MALHWRNDFDWLDKAACRGSDPAVFFEEEALDVARSICKGCTVRLACLDHALDEEEGMPREEIFGVRAYTTPAQRVSIRRRGWHGADPVHLVHGYDDHADRQVPPIPDDGDRWSRHHTTLARKVLKWLKAYVPEGDRIPSQTAICEAIPCKPGPLRIVLDALVADGTLDLHGPRERRVGDNGSTRYYVRRTLPKAIGAWEPPHLRGE